jgi:hypothetical protein
MHCALSVPLLLVLSLSPAAAQFCPINSNELSVRAEYFSSWTFPSRGGSYGNNVDCVASIFSSLTSYTLSFDISYTTEEGFDFIYIASSRDCSQSMTGPSCNSIRLSGSGTRRFSSPGPIYIRFTSDSSNTFPIPFVLRNILAVSTAAPVVNTGGSSGGWGGLYSFTRWHWSNGIIFMPFLAMFVPSLVALLVILTYCAGCVVTPIDLEKENFKQRAAALTVLLSMLLTSVAFILGIINVFTLWVASEGLPVVRIIFTASLGAEAIIAVISSFAALFLSASTHAQNPQPTTWLFVFKLIAAMCALGRIDPTILFALQLPFPRIGKLCLTLGDATTLTSTLSLSPQLKDFLRAPTFHASPIGHLILNAASIAMYTYTVSFFPITFVMASAAALLSLFLLLCVSAFVLKFPQAKTNGVIWSMMGPRLMAKSDSESELLSEQKAAMQMADMGGGHAAEALDRANDERNQ